MINILLIYDHSYFDERVVSILEEQDNINVASISTSGIDALDELKTTKVDVVLLDIAMPEMDMVELYQQIKINYSEAKIIVLTGETDTQFLYNIWGEKIDGILTKSCSSDELVSTIMNVEMGQKIIGESVPPFFENTNTLKTIPKLTRKEIEVLKLLGTGLSRKEAANKLFISIDTVSFHCRNIYSKFNRNTISLVVAEARKHGMIK